MHRPKTIAQQQQQQQTMKNYLSKTNVKYFFLEDSEFPPWDHPLLLLLPPLFLTFSRRHVINNSRQFLLYLSSSFFFQISFTKLKLSPGRPRYPSRYFCQRPTNVHKNRSIDITKKIVCEILSNFFCIDYKKIFALAEISNQKKKKIGRKTFLL